MSIPADIVRLILLNTRALVIGRIYSISKQINTMLIGEQFWRDKLALVGIPLVVLENKPTMMNYISIYLKTTINRVWITLYQEMVSAYDTAKCIITISKINKISGYVDDKIMITLYDEYNNKDDVLPMLPTMNIDIPNYSPNLIDIKCEDDSSNTYNIKYTVLNTDTDDFNTYSVEVNEAEVLYMMSLFILYYRIGRDNIRIIDPNHHDYLNSYHGRMNGMIALYKYFTQS
jgi:hypothetical protein